MTFPDDPLTEGIIRYNTEALQGYNSYKDQFIIESTPPAYSSFEFTLVVCNPDLLPADIRALKNDNTQTTAVKFGGAVKRACEQPVSVPEHFYDNITLTTIERK